MKRRSFIASIMAGLSALALPFIPKSKPTIHMIPDGIAIEGKCIINISNPLKLPLATYGTAMFDARKQEWVLIATNEKG